MESEEAVIQDTPLSVSQTAESSDIDDSDENNQFLQPSGRRWDPLGEAAPDDDDDSTQTTPFDTDARSTIDPSRIKSLEEEQEMLSSSLFALTSHFAQVQFRLRQIVDSPQEQRDELLQSLEEFAFRGIPEMTKVDVGEHEPLFKAMEQQRQRQFDLIDQLKRQLTDVEKFAYDAGSNQLPQSVLVEKQKIIIDELKNKLNLTVCGEDLPQLTTEELRTQVDNALVELVGPVKMKDTLVGQLKTQIVDLERFVAYLQCETYDLKQLTKAVGGFKDCESSYATYNSKMAKQKSRTNSSSGMGQSHPLLPSPNPYPASTSSSGASSKTKNSDLGAESLSHKAAGVLEKASNILNIFAVTQLGCGANGFQKNTLKKTTKGNHWGDLRAQLEIDIQEIISLVASTMIRPTAPPRRRKLRRNGDKDDVSETTSDDDDYDDDTDDDHFNVDQYSEEMLASIHLEITTMVRKHFAITLQRLMEHGLREDVASSSTSLVPFIGCFSRRPVAAMQKRSAAPRLEQLDYGSDEEHRQMHVWELILEYYHIKNGDQFNETPARKLSQSFNLDISGASSATSNKQSLLAAIGNIINIHAPYKRSYNSHFKALISMGINCQKLTQWLNLIFQCRELVQQYYTEWSYVRRTGFRDALKSIDRLSCYHFDLPVDLAIRQFQNIKDVFM